MTIRYRSFMKRNGVRRDSLGITPRIESLKPVRNSGFTLRDCVSKIPGIVWQKEGRY